MIYAACFFCFASAKRQYRRIFFDVFSISSFKIVKEKERAYGDVLSCGEAETLGASLLARTPQRKHICYLTLRSRVIRVKLC